MKKTPIVSVLIGLILFIPFAANAEFSFATAWRQWSQSRQSFFQIFIPKTPSLKTLPSYVPQIPSRGRVPSYIPQQTKVTPSRSTALSSLYKKKPLSFSVKDKEVSMVQARVKAIRPRQSVHTITTDPIDIFKIGIRNTTPANSMRFTEAMLLDRATFSLFSNAGIAEDIKNLELEIEGNTMSFDADGLVTINFHNARITRGDSLELNVSIRIKDPDTTPHIPGTLRLRLEKMTAIGESSQKKIDVKILGTSTSSNIVFDPVSRITGSDSQVSGNTYTHITGGTIAAGEDKYVMAANFSAYYDDLSIREITLRNTLTGNNIDSFIDGVRAIDLHTGKVVATGRFSNGAAKLRLSPRVFVGRNQQARLAFEVTATDPVPNSSLDARFELDIAPADLFVESKTNGRPLPDANKSFSIDSEIFSVSQGKMTIAATGQQKSFAVGTNRPETVFRFIVNGGAQSVSLGRISLDAYPSGLEFNGGTLDASDVQLVRINGSRQENESANITVSGNKITLDFPMEFYIYKNDSVEFGLQLKLDNLPGNNDSDLISMRLLGDSTHSKGTLSSVRSGGSNFIWSDTSARMHSTTTSDWVSGYLVSGLPSNSTVVKRFGN